MNKIAAGQYIAEWETRFGTKAKIKTLDKLAEGLTDLQAAKKAAKGDEALLVKEEGKYTVFSLSDGSLDSLDTRNEINFKEGLATKKIDLMLLDDDGDVIAETDTESAIMRLFDTFKEHDTHTVKGREWQYSAGVEVEEGADGKIFNEYDWQKEERPIVGDTSDNKIRNPEYDSLKAKLIDYDFTKDGLVAQGELEMASFNLMQDFFAHMTNPDKPFSELDSVIDLAVVEKNLHKFQEEGKLRDSFINFMNTTLDSYNEIIGEDHDYWSPTYTERKQDLLEFAQSVGIKPEELSK